MFTAYPAHAELTIEEVLQRMDQAQKPVKDIAFDFVMHARQGQFQGKTTGQVQLKKPQRLRVLEKTPVKQTILTDGKTLWLYVPKQKQVLRGDWARWVQQSGFPLVLMNFVGAFNQGRWQDQFQASLLGHEDKLYKIRFNEPGVDTTVIDLWLSDETFLPVRAERYNRPYPVQVRIKDLRTNVNLTDASFEPRFPEGTAEIPVSF